MCVVRRREDSGRRKEAIDEGEGAARFARAFIYVEGLIRGSSTTQRLWTGLRKTAMTAYKSVRVIIKTRQSRASRFSFLSSTLDTSCFKSARVYWPYQRLLTLALLSNRLNTHDISIRSWLSGKVTPPSTQMSRRVTLVGISNTGSSASMLADRAWTDVWKRS